MSKSNFIVRGGADFGKLYKELNTAQTRMTSFQTGIGKTLKGIGAVLGSLAVGKLIKDSTAMAIGVESSLDNISRNMGESSAAFRQWVDTQSKALAMGRAEAYKYGSTFSNLIGVFARDAKETAGYTEDLMKAAAIISSKTGRTYEDTANRIRSGMLGSTEAIEDLGVYTNVSIMESTEAFKKFANGKSWAQLDFQTQQQIRLTSILEQTYERYGDTLADTTQTRQSQFIASLKDIQLSLGQVFLPIYNAVLPALTAMANALGRIVNMAAQFSQAVFGKPVVQATKNVEEQAEAVAGLGDATKAAGKAAKGALAGFDELNVLQKAEAAGGGAGAVVAPETGAADSGGMAGAAEGIAAKVQEFLQPLKEISFDNLIAAFDRLKIAAEPLGAAIFEGLQWAYLNIFVPLAAWTIEDVLPAFLDVLSGALKVLSAVISALMPLGVWLWDTFLKPLAAWTGGAIVTILEGVADALTKVSDWISGNEEIVRTATITIAGFFGAWKLTEALAFIQMSGGLVAAISGVTIAIKAGTLAKIADKFETIYLTALYAKDFVVALAKGTVELIKQAAQWAISTGLKAANTVAQIAMNAATAAWNAICVIATAVTTAFGAAVAFLTSPIGLVILAIAAIIAIVVLLIKNWDTVKAAAAKAWEGIKSTWAVVAAWFNTAVVTPIANFFGGLWNGIKSAGGLLAEWMKTKVIDPVVNLFKGMYNSVIGIVEGMINGFIGLINGFIRGINRAVSTINMIPGVDLPTIKTMATVTIPRLAKGGLVSDATLAMVGEAGQEAVLPLENNTGWMDQLAERIAPDVNITFKGDLAALARVLNPVITKEQKRRGGSLIMGVTG